MNKKDVIKHFGSQKELAKKLKISSEAISQWGDKVPQLRAFQIELLTDGKFKAPRE